MFGKNEKKLVTMEGQSKPFLRFYDASENERAYLGMTDKNDPELLLSEPSGKEGALLEDQEGGYLKIFDSIGRERAYFGTSTSEDPILKMWDTSDTQRAFLGTYTSGVFGLQISDSSGTATWSTP
jgi:hypothetical protein